MAKRQAQARIILAQTSMCLLRQEENNPGFQTDKRGGAAAADPGHAIVLAGPR
jgi:hypothetical protein